MIRFAFMLSLLATPLVAQQMDADAFADYVTNKTLGFNGINGQPFGRESYFKGQRVIWSAAPTQCLHGTWYEEDGAICFAYENDPDPKCWIVNRTDNGITAQSIGPDGIASGTILFEAEVLDTPLSCPGPDLLS